MSHRQVLEALSGLLLGMFVSMLAGTVVSTSLPVIVSELKGDQTAYTWVITSTLLTTAIATPIWGKLADLINRKFLIQLALVIFVAASATAGLAQDTNMLIASRAVQGIGAGGMAALSQVIMADIISPRERGRYMGLFGAVMAVSTIGGPLLGGFITDVSDWRWNFYIAIPFAVVALFLLQKTLHLPKLPKRAAHIDYVGIVLLSVGSSLLLIWMSLAGKSAESGGFEWNSWQTYAMVGGVVLAVILFIITELRAKDPLVPLSLFRNPTFTLSVLASIATGVTMFGASVFLAQYMQMSRGASPTQAGLMTLPMIGGLLISSIVVGQLITRYGKWKAWMVAGSISLTVSVILMTTLEYNTNFWLVSLYMALMGIGVGVTMQNLVLVVQNTAHAKEMGVATSGVTFFRSLGGTVGVSVMGAGVAASVAGLMGDRKGDIMAALTALGEKGQEIAQQFQTGSLPEVAKLPDGIRQIIEDIYAQSIAGAFVVGIPLAIISVIAIAFLPNKPLGRQTAAERLVAETNALATEPAGAALAAAATGPIQIADDKK